MRRGSELKNHLSQDYKPLLHGVQPPYQQDFYNLEIPGLNEVPNAPYAQLLDLDLGFPLKMPKLSQPAHAGE